MKVLDGSEVAGFIKERQAKQVRNLRQSWGVNPKFAIIQTIDSPVIDMYVRLKRRYAEEILVESEVLQIDQKETLGTIEALNARDDIHGIIVQLPLADAEQTDMVVQRVASEKDVDGLGSAPQFDPATPLAINWLLAAYGVDLARQSIGIIGRGRLVGAPLEMLWRSSGYDVTVYDRASGFRPEQIRRHDVIVTATGVPHLVTTDMVRQGAVVVDAGTASEDGVVVGDVDVSLRERDDLTITPLKGGVGPLTIAALIDNVIVAARRVAERQRSSD